MADVTLTFKRNTTYVTALDLGQTNSSGAIAPGSTEALEGEVSGPPGNVVAQPPIITNRLLKTSFSQEDKMLFWDYATGELRAAKLYDFYVYLNSTVSNPQYFRVTEDGEQRLTEDGFERVLET